MSARIRFLVGLPLLATLAACEAPLSPGVLPGEVDAPAAASRVETVSVPFKAQAYTTLVSLAPDPSCGAPPYFLNIQEGEGTATHLGRFDVRFTFCVDATDLLDDGLLTEGEALPYDRGVGILTAANGDELLLSIEGAVVPSSDPDYDFQFQDAFEFTGGTGRFSGAAGAGATDSYVIQATDRTDHAWSGSLVLQPGR